jgi:phage tail-like protein
MSLINGPTSIKKEEEAARKKLKDMIPASLGIKAMRQLEKLLGMRFEAAPAYLFYVEISGLMVALFTECSGLGAHRSVETVREGGLNDKVHQLAGPVEYDHIFLKRGLTASRALWDWFEQGQYDFKVKRLNMSITQGAAGMNLVGMAVSAIGGGSGYGVVKTWNLERAFPLSWKLSELSVANTTAVAVESLEIVHEGITLSPVFGTPMSAIG